MDWILDNALWLFFVGVFIWMHVKMHGGHGGHGGHGHAGERGHGAGHGGCCGGGQDDEEDTEPAGAGDSRGDEATRR